MHRDKPRAWLQHLVQSFRWRGRKTIAQNQERYHARNGKVRAETCDASHPTPNARAADRQEPPYSASTLPPTPLPAQPKPRSVLHETLQS
jgi:hypothetical protein